MPSPISARLNGKKGGRPKGKKAKSTLEREAVMRAYQQRVMQMSDRLLDYQLSLARGTTYLFKIEKELIIGPKGGKTYKSKKPELVTDVEEIRSYLEGITQEGDLGNPKDPNGTYYYLTSKDPDSRTIDSMLDRGIGKPAQAFSMQDGEGKSLPITQINLIPVKI